MTAIRVARRRGLSVPGQLSIVGFGDHSDAKFADPALTSIAQPHEEVARCAVRQLLTHVESGPEDVLPPSIPQRIATGFNLIVRDSTAPPA